MLSMVSLLNSQNCPVYRIHDRQRVVPPALGPGRCSPRLTTSCCGVAREAFSDLFRPSFRCCPCAVSPIVDYPVLSNGP